jgi:hypothetical protein|tara:strand:+ start:3227 stop:3511 length:285 start_codon:yes stop_codon:yes gene_type:complete
MREFKLGLDVVPIRNVNLQVDDAVEFVAQAHEQLHLTLQGKPFRFPGGSLILYPGQRYRVELTQTHLLLGEVEGGPPEAIDEEPNTMPDDAETV